MKDNFTLEKLKVHERLLELEKQQEAFKVIQSDCHTKITDVHDLLLGGGTQENPNLITRIDRLEQSEVNRNIHRGVLYAAMVSLILERVWRIISGRP